MLCKCVAQRRGRKREREREIGATEVEKKGLDRQLKRCIVL